MLLGYARSHRPGQIFPYLDDEPFSYPHLAEYLRILEHDFGATARLTTVGYSRKNAALVAMHDDIAQNLASAIVSLRVSVTPYTLLWRLSDQSDLPNNEFAADLTHLFRQYREFEQRLGYARDRYCVELRTAPLVQRFQTELTERTIERRHVISLGPYLAIATQRDQILPVAQASDVLARGDTSPSVTGDYVLVIGDSSIAPELVVPMLSLLQLEPDTHRMLLHTLPNGKTIALARRRVIRLQNIDGEYFSIGGLPSEYGYRTEINLYPRTETRRCAAAIYRVRHFLNHIIDYKRSLGLDRRAALRDATWVDADRLLHAIAAEATFITAASSDIAQHIKHDILPLIRLVLFAMKKAGHPPGDFFSYGFLWDTGSITNLGRALTTIFGGIVSQWYHPLSMNEEKGYGYHAASASGQRQSVLRIAPAPASYPRDHMQHGFRTPTAIPGGGMIVELLDSHIQPIPSYQHAISGVPVTMLLDADKRSHALVPGV